MLQFYIETTGPIVTIPVQFSKIPAIKMRKEDEQEHKTQALFRHLIMKLFAIANRETSGFTKL